MFIPIRTESPIRRTPLANYALLGVNILVFFVLDAHPSEATAQFKNDYFVLAGESARWFQYITYQFSHADPWHLIGNMLFLWVFGNSVNAKLRDLPYVAFYLAGGVFAGLLFKAFSNYPLLGASGSIAAVTTGYLVLYPRSRVTVLYAFFFIGFIEIPAMWLILIKIVLWDNLVSPRLLGAGNVAYEAHLAGYLFGFVVAMAMLILKWVPRDQFDMLALVKRWNQRRAFVAAMESPEAQARARYGSVAKTPSPADVEREKRFEEIQSLRSRISERINQNEMTDALALYEQLLAIDPQQCLSAEQQMRIARTFYEQARFIPAAAAFERYLQFYSAGHDANEVRLLLGIIYARDLRQYESAEKHLTTAYEEAVNPSRKEQAARWLERIRQSPKHA